MSSKHTPGPWVAYEIAPEDPSWGACEIWPVENDREDDEGAVKPVATMVMGVENARLIAAAPELLAAVQCLMGELMDLRGMEQSHNFLKGARALSKATGEA
jgi:hypothetical protein